MECVWAPGQLQGRLLEAACRCHGAASELRGLSVPGATSASMYRWIRGLLRLALACICLLQACWLVLPNTCQPC